MKGKFWKSIKFDVALAIVLLSVVFAIPFKTVSYEEIETYWDTEMKQEFYVVNEPYVMQELREKSEVIFDGFQLTVPLGIEILFYVNKPDTRIVCSFENPTSGGVYIFSASSGHIIYEKLGRQGIFEITLPEGDYKARFTENVEWGERAYIRLVKEWTESEDVTMYREVTKYRDVPVKVEKQRAVTKYRKTSIWGVVFGY